MREAAPEGMVCSPLSHESGHVGTRALSNSPVDCWNRLGRQSAGRAVLVPVCTGFHISTMLHKRKMPCFSARHFLVRHQREREENVPVERF